MKASTDAKSDCVTPARSSTGDSKTNEVLRKWRDSARYWQKHSATIRTMFAPVTRALTEQAGIAEGQSVLDVAGGPGEPSLTIAGNSWNQWSRDVHRRCG